MTVYLYGRKKQEDNIVYVIELRSELVGKSELALEIWRVNIIFVIFDR